MILTHVDSQKCEQDTEIFPPKISSQLHLQKIHNSNEENGHESSQDIRQVIFEIFIFLIKLFTIIKNESTT